jgi:hypothetical protein
MAKRKPTDARRTLAEEIARRLFTNGADQKAQRLVLEMPNGGNGGGWSEKPMADYIERILVEQAQ